MKEYRAFLDGCQLYNCPELHHLLQNKKKYDQICGILLKTDQDVGLSIDNIKQMINHAESKSKNAIAFLDDQINNLSSKKLKAKQIGPDGKTEIYRCGCGQETKKKQHYARHLRREHEGARYVDGASHFVTIFGNVVPYTASVMDGYRGTDIEETQYIKHEVEKEQIEKEIAETKVKKKRSAIGPSNGKEKIQLETKPQQPNEQQENKEQFYCGECQKTFDNYRRYAFHLQTHDFIINPDSSHIIVRNRSKFADPMPIKAPSNTDQRKRYSCPCNLSNNYSRAQYVSHVLKWHKGIVPKK